jgi:hypothetical protein
VENIKNLFLVLIDGVHDIPAKYEGIDSFKLGICKLDFTDGTFHIHLRRPGLLIGKKGHQITKIIADLEVPVKLHEVNLLD